MEMAKPSDTFTLRVRDPNGMIFEVPDVPLDRLAEIRTQFSLNGHDKNQNAPNYEGLKKSLSEKAKQFLKLLHNHPEGISADILAEEMKFKSGTQIGGMTGGGLSKLAKKFHVELTDVYVLQVDQHNGQRVTTYKPGKEIQKLL